MTRTKEQLVQDFFKAIAKGELPDELVTPEMTFWSVNSGTAERARFQGAVKILSSIFNGTLTYVIESLTAQDDRIAAEISSHGTLNTGEKFNNTHIFLFYVCDGRIAAAKEYMNQFAVREKIVPLMQAAMTKS
jgi:ketosteroid isomerase-like protein